MTSKGREVLRGLASVFGGGEVLDVAEKFAGLLERAASKAPPKGAAKRRPPKRAPLELVEGGRGDEGPREAPRQVGAGETAADYRAAPPGAKALVVEVKPAKRRG